MSDENPQLSESSPSYHSAWIDLLLEWAPCSLVDTHLLSFELIEHRLSIELIGLRESAKLNAVLYCQVVCLVGSGTVSLLGTSLESSPNT